MLERLGSLPGVSAAAGVSHLPISQNYEIATVELEDRAVPRQDRERATLHAVTSDLFRTLELPLVSGRSFSHQECLNGGDVVMISQELSRRLWGEDGALGRRLGATNSDLLRLMGRHGVGLACLGALLGAFLAIIATQFGAAMLYGVSTRDPLVFGGVGILMLLVGTLASVLPARRLLKTNLTAALRAE